MSIRAYVQCVAFTWLWIAASGLRAQTVIPDAPSCSSCRIVLEDLLRIDSSPDARFPDAVSMVLADGRGRYWVFFLNGLPLVYDAQGRFVRQFEPKGGPNGAGRSQPRSALVIPGDSMLIYDVRRATLYVVGPEFTGRAIAPAAVSGGLGAGVVLTWPDRVLLAAPVSYLPGGVSGVFSRPDGVRRDDVFPPYHFVSLYGSSVLVSLSFGEGESGGLTSAGRDGAWAWYGGTYWLERWSRTGETTKVIERHPSWWPPDQVQTLSANTPPPAHMRVVHQDEAGLLWTFAMVPKSNWQAAMTAPTEVGLYRTTIEVIDPSADRLVTSATFDGLIVSPMAGDRAAISEIKPDGNGSIRIVRFRLVR